MITCIPCGIQSMTLAASFVERAVMFNDAVTAVAVAVMVPIVVVRVAVAKTVVCNDWSLICY